MPFRIGTIPALFLVTAALTAPVLAQSVCLPAPRLLTTMPMGGKTGSSFDVTISGEYLEDADELVFSHFAMRAVPKVGDTGLPVPNVYTVTIDADCPPGIHEARVMTRLGLSSARAFNVGTLSETTRSDPNTSLATAKPLELNSICNAVMTRQAVDYYSFEAAAGQRVVVDCAAKGVDSKLKPVLIVADESGADLRVERRGGAIDFTAPTAGKYVVKVHDLTFTGGSEYFYRLALQAAAAGETVPRQPSVQMVNSFSWPPAGLAEKAPLAEAEPNHQQAQKIELPCDLAGSFYPAADVDVFEFTAQKGDVWWVEVASERLGLATDPSIVVQHVNGDTVTDVAEFSDIASPVKVSSNGYSYDGPPYNAGSSDINGRLEIKEDGLHRLQIRDLFGGTRNEPQNVYRLIIRKEQPDFAVVGWALHMGLRNGDRAALSKPVALRGGSTIALEVVAVRRDGFNGEIDLFMEDLPEGVTATGVKIPAGQSRGIMLVSASPNAPRGYSKASFLGQAEINGEVVTRTCRLASMQWPVPDASQQIPAPRLVADAPVSVCGSELAPLTITPAEEKIWEVTVGEKLTIPFVQTQRSDFSGSSLSVTSWNSGIGNIPEFELPLNANSSEAVIDTAALKSKPGEYVVAFYGGAVAKYRHNLASVAVAEVALKQAQQDAEAVDQADAEKKKTADAAVAAADQRLKEATKQAQPRDIVDIIVTTPVTIRVKPVEQAETK